MTTSQIDYMSVFRNLPTPVLLLTPDLVMVDANDAYEEISGRMRAELIGRSPFDAFPENPDEPGSGTTNLERSLRRVAATGATDIMAPQRYDVEVPGSPGVFRERYWCPVNSAIRGPDGEVTVIIHCVEEVSDLIRKFVEAEAANA